MTFTAIVPVSGRGNGRDSVRYMLAQASSSMSALSARFSLVRILASSEVAVADEERLLVVRGIDHPQGYPVGVIASGLTGVRVVDVHAVEDHTQIVALALDLMSGSPKTVNRLPAPVFFSSSPMTRSAFIAPAAPAPAPERRSAATLAKPSVGGDVVVVGAEHRRIEREAEYAQQVEFAGPVSLAGRILDEGGATVPYCGRW